MAELFQTITLRGTKIRNRVWVSPMCQYSATDGLSDTWHLVHLGQFAVGGAGLVMTEAAAITPAGRISPTDTGLWSEAHEDAWRPIVKAQGARIGIQLAHLFKASTSPPLDTDDIALVVSQSQGAAKRALRCGFDVIEIHAAHGYLIHQFLSPLSNDRTDEYGGDFDGRTRLLFKVADAIRHVWPDDRPLFVRVSATDWVEGGWDVAETVALAAVLAGHGVDLLDSASGGTVPDAPIEPFPGYQVEFARRVREDTSTATGPVGLITEPRLADKIVAEDQQMSCS